MINRNIVGAYPYPGEVNKRPALSENNAPSNKNHMPIPPILANRPITRKFAAKMAGKQKQPLPEETKKVVQSLPILTESRDFSIIDVDDYKIVGDSTALMFVQHTEAMLEEIYRMEVEMENTTNELVVDIESSDKRNPLAVVEYINDIYAYYKKVESSSCVLPNYTGQQFDINERLRGILIDWLIEMNRCTTSSN
ncbi:hypothetical protein CsSME_00040214 [Camellia sinensis var. sinensis]